MDKLWSILAVGEKTVSAATAALRVLRKRVLGELQQRCRNYPKGRSVVPSTIQRRPITVET